MHAAGHTLGDIAAQHELEYRADDNLLILPGFVADDGNAEVEYRDADTATEAANEYVDDGDWGDGDESFAVTVWVWRTAATIDDDGQLQYVEVDRDSYLIVRDPPEPECEASESGEHRWEAPYKLVGGIRENPGVWGRGAGVATLQVCVLCGTCRNENTATQGANTEHDHDTVSYGGDDDCDVEKLAKHHGYRFPEGLKRDSKLAAALRERVEDGLLALESWQDYDANESEMSWDLRVDADDADSRIEALREQLPQCTIEPIESNEREMIVRIRIETV